MLKFKKISRHAQHASHKTGTQNRHTQQAHTASPQGRHTAGTQSRHSTHSMPAPRAYNCKAGTHSTRACQPPRQAHKTGTHSRHTQHASPTRQAHKTGTHTAGYLLVYSAAFFSSICTLCAGHRTPFCTQHFLHRLDLHARLFLVPHGQTVRTNLCPVRPFLSQNIKKKWDFPSRVS